MKTDDLCRSIGKVVSVAADRFVVELHAGSDNFTVIGFDDVHYVARLGSYIVIPVRADYVVAEIVQLRERDSGPSRGSSERELERAGSAKFLDIVPIGTLPQDQSEAFRFGVSTFPSLYADALYALDTELDRIFDVAGDPELVPRPPLGDGDGKETRTRALMVGDSVVFADYQVKARVEQLFGGHAAILGNTGSGKSCTVASIFQSLFSKADERQARGASLIFFDVNGEYRSAFSKLPPAIRRLTWHTKDDPKDQPVAALDPREDTAVFRLPHWFLSLEEWELLLRASERTQQPVLRAALGLTSLLAKGQAIDQATQNHIVAKAVLETLENSTSPVSSGTRMEMLLTRFATADLSVAVLNQHGFNRKFGNFPEGPSQSNFIAKVTGFLKEDVPLPTYQNTPFPFDALESCLELAITYEEAHGNRQIREYCSQLVTRVKDISKRSDYAFLRITEADLLDHEKSSDVFLDKLIGLKKTSQGVYQKTTQITLLDLNSAPDEVVEIASAVVARMLFERLRRAEPRNAVPVTLVLEEAHRYISERKPSFAIDASKIFERIAKEGRKYGLLLVLASQRPSELSRTVLSQCSNFIVHRIQNPDDLLHIRQMTPFVSENVLKRLPSLPRQHALIFGNAVNLPMTFRVRDADPKPKSDDATIRDVLFAKSGGKIKVLWG